jgi:hypothetical protein
LPFSKGYLPLMALDVEPVSALVRDVAVTRFEEVA